MRKPRLFYYMPQRIAVMHDLDNLLMTTPEFIGLDERGDRVRGIRGGAFVNIATHPVQPPYELLLALRIQGFAIITFDDTWVRAAAMDRMRQ